MNADRTFYVAIGEGPHRSWDDMRQYGFVCGGQRRWYSRTLHQLEPGDLVFAYVPKRGFVGVGVVEEPACPVRDFAVEFGGGHRSLLDMPLRQPNLAENADDDERSEYCVRVRWSDTRSADAAVRESGMYANQNTATKLRDEETLAVLRREFDLPT